VLNTTSRDAFNAIRMLKEADPQRYAPANGADYPRSASARRCADRAARQGGSRPRGRVRRIGQLGSPRQRRRRDGQLANRLDDLRRGIAALVRDLGDRMQDVVILTMSEFGRTVAENGNRGTDTATATR
jgi:uncharacterized protein (DUF1501 family)